jgi:ParB family chromosome partitioning protein
MSRKQSAYLATLLSDADADTDTPVPDARPRRPLLQRENALARLATGEVRQVAELRLDPARCRIWPGNGRYYANLDLEACRDLVDSIVAEGAQRVPAIVRHIKNDPDHDYEVIAGTRRHWAVSWLRANNYPETVFLAQVQDVDDEQAFRLADLENRARKDLTDLERARNYKDALQQHYGGVQARMAERLRISRSWLSRLLALAALPESIVAAFPSQAALQVKGGYELAVLAQREDQRRRMLDEAEQLVAEQDERRARAEEPLSAADAGGARDTRTGRAQRHSGQHRAAADEHPGRPCRWADAAPTCRQRRRHRGGAGARA